MRSRASYLAHELMIEPLQSEPSPCSVEYGIWQHVADSMVGSAPAAVAAAYLQLASRCCWRYVQQCAAAPCPVWHSSTRAVSSTQEGRTSSSLLALSARLLAGRFLRGLTDRLPMPPLQLFAAAVSIALLS